MALAVLSVSVLPLGTTGAAFADEQDAAAEQAAETEQAVETEQADGAGDHEHEEGEHGQDGEEHGEGAHGDEGHGELPPILSFGRGRRSRLATEAGNGISAG